MIVASWQHSKFKIQITEISNLCSIYIIGKNPSPTLARDRAKVEYISGGQPLFYELAFGVELGPNTHSKMLVLGFRNSCNLYKHWAIICYFISFLYIFGSKKSVLKSSY